MPVATFSRTSRWSAREELVELAPDANALPELSLLLALGQYLIMLAADDAAASAATVAATS